MCVTLASKFGEMAWQKRHASGTNVAMSCSAGESPSDSGDGEIDRSLSVNLCVLSPLDFDLVGSGGMVFAAMGDKPAARRLMFSTLESAVSWSSTKVASPAFWDLLPLGLGVGATETVSFETDVACAAVLECEVGCVHGCCGEMAGGTVGG